MDVRCDFAGLSPQFRRELILAVLLCGKGTAKLFETDYKQREALADIVMKLTCDALPFFLLCLDKAASPDVEDSLPIAARFLPPLFSP